MTAVLPQRGSVHNQSLYLDNSPRPRLHFGAFQEEPAITGFDWHFTPIPDSHERLLTASLRASTQLSLRFTLIRNRSTGFGSYPRDFSHFRTTPLTVLRACCFRYGSGARHSLALPLRYTPCPVFQNGSQNPAPPRSYCELSLRSFTGDRRLKALTSLEPSRFGLFSPPFEGYFSAFAHATSALSDSRCV